MKDWTEPFDEFIQELFFWETEDADDEYTAIEDGSLILLEDED